MNINDIINVYEAYKIDLEDHKRIEYLKEKINL